MKRQILIAVAILALAITAGTVARELYSPPARHVEATDSISVRMPIPIVETGQAPFYVAADRGNYTEEKLNVKFNLGSPELNPVRMVSSGTDTFGVLGGPDTLLVARSKGAKIKAIAVIHRNSNFSAIVALKQSGITSPKQLEGRKVGFYYGHISTDVLRALFRKEGVHVVEVDTGFDYVPLLTGRVDAEWAFTVTAGLELPAKGTPINIINPAQYGIVTQGYTIFATDETIKNHPDLVERFLRATFKGICDVVNEPNSGIDAIHSRAPSTPIELLRRRQSAYNAVTSCSIIYPAGYMNRRMFSDTYSRLVSLGVITNKFNVDDAYTTQFLDDIYHRNF